MDASQVQHWTHDVRPMSCASQSFKNVPLTPLHDENWSPNTSSGFSHVPLEHEVIASESVWDDFAVSDELCEQQTTISTDMLGEGSPAVAVPGTPSDKAVIAVGNQAQFPPRAWKDPEQEEPSPKSTILKSQSELAFPITLGSPSAVALVETSLAVDTISGPTFPINKVSFSTKSPTESDITDELRKSSERVKNSIGPAELKTLTPLATMVGRATLPRAESAENLTPTSSPGFFEIPVPIFPFPAGTSRCKTRNCPIKGRHERGPYLHEGKLRTREGSIFGSSNPPPKIWSLYDLSKKLDLEGTGNMDFSAVELFVKYHFGETRGECIPGSLEAGGRVPEGSKQGGRRLRFWRVWR